MLRHVEDITASWALHEQATFVKTKVRTNVRNLTESKKKNGTKTDLIKKQSRVSKEIPIGRKSAAGARWISATADGGSGGGGWRRGSGWTAAASGGGDLGFGGARGRAGASGGSRPRLLKGRPGRCPRRTRPGKAVTFFK